MTQIHFHLNFNTDKYISVGSVPKTTGLGFLVLYIIWIIQKPQTWHLEENLWYKNLALEMIHFNIFTSFISPYNLF